MAEKHASYYVPAQSPWPIVGAIGLGLIAFGAGHTVLDVSKQQEGYGSTVLSAGLVVIAVMLFGWFRDQINESMRGLYSDQLGNSYRQGMAWFIFSEVMFFAAFFGALFYARMVAVPWLGGASNNAMTNEVLWPTFDAIWPLVKTPGGTETQAMGWYGLPLINTAILVTSSFTCHFAHMGLEKGKRGQLKLFLGLTIILGAIFLYLQGAEYVHAYHELGLTLQSGVYGNTFYLLTGFHGMHVTLGTLMLIIMFLRILKGHFSADNHFAFQATSWYWHFVDAVWIALFVIVYVL
ncbi:cytochrome c oxidase subunit 3 [Idiomarina xiamenensis]|uniref:cytochrome-c oxidase n=1 Tax=Idiomarina xiamenensis 10-D-4 TaxID=740709 RepID=K2K185_9GAMM|nr:cytochrome c oxidase subunit 3 [Idiomarina xiamenensis]EKE81498.1 cytochrome c oxidase subunit III [Idiomarina xiamenensis 10-D-4]